MKKQIRKARDLQKIRAKEIKPRVECECFSEIGKCISVVEASRWIVSALSKIGKCLNVVGP